MEPKKLVEYTVFIGLVAGTLVASRAVAGSKRYSVTRATGRAGKTAAKSAGKSAGRAAVRAGARRRR